MSRLLAITILVLGLSACATPDVALDQANHGVRLIQNLQTELVRYKSNVKISAERRLAAIQRADEENASLVVNQKMETYLAGKAGMDAELAARERIRDASDTYTRLLAEQDKAKQDLAIRLSELVKDLPTPTEKLGAVQKAMAELGTELSAKERVEIVATFLKQAKCIADQATKPPATAASPSEVAPKCTSEPNQAKEQA